MQLPEASDAKELSPDEVLRLVLAFYCIMEPEKRAELLSLAESYASASTEGARQMERPQVDS
ncbi:MAG TPA: hypothetical protein VM842_02065 [Nitrospira sp.]|jgi:hypothetical protein|nr:hypothetical protein [Nitrospira sp.]